ncbi:phage tail tape measure protein [Shewanella xiamenensis]|uniref:phage tail tape measure protein n=1 Tax=Shewanella xiamenensis TaxID=332186 RepID=UPI00084998A4|nr:phage tail tape measure protein [Shewanella xiamenensis]
MSNKLQTSIILNLAGNLDGMAKKYGAAFDNMGTRAQKGFGVVQRSAGMAINGLDALGNRYSGVAASAVSAVAIKGVADFSKQMTRLGTDANLTIDQVSALKQEITDVASSADINIDRTELADAASALLGRTGDYEFVRKNLRNLGLSVQGFGADAKSSGELFAAMYDQGIREAGDVERMMDRLLMQFAKGSISIAELAKESPKLFSQLRSGGEAAMTKMGALFQVFAKTKGSAAEVTTAVEGVFRVLSNKDKVAQLERSGIAVYTDASKQKMRDQFDILMDIMKKSEHLGDRQLEALSGVFDDTGLSGLRALMNKENFDLYDELVNGSIKLGATQEASNRNASELGAILIGIRGHIYDIADAELTEPLKEFSQWLKTVDRDTLKMVANLTAGVVGLVVAVKTAKALGGAYGWTKNTVDHILKGPKGKPALGNVPGATGMLGATPVYVVNMPGSGMGDLPGSAQNPSTKPNDRKRTAPPSTSSNKFASAANLVVTLSSLYAAKEIGDSLGQSTADAINQTATGQWLLNNKSEIEGRNADTIFGMQQRGEVDFSFFGGLTSMLGKFFDKAEAKAVPEPIKADLTMTIIGEGPQKLTVAGVKSKSTGLGEINVLNGPTSSVMGG